MCNLLRPPLLYCWLCPVCVSQSNHHHAWFIPFLLHTCIAYTLQHRVYDVYDPVPGLHVHDNDLGRGDAGGDDEVLEKVRNGKDSCWYCSLLTSPSLLSSSLVTVTYSPPIVG